MVKIAETTTIHSGDALAAERSLAMGYTPPSARPAVAALFALDARLGDILRGTREPMVGQMRLTWWHEALERLDGAAPPAEPVLAALADEVLPRGIDGAALAAMIDGWEVLLDGGAMDETALATHAAARGGRLFVLAGRLLGVTDEPVVAAGEGWALADLAANLSDPVTVALARRLAHARLSAVTTTRWARAARGLGALALLARMDAAPNPRVPGHPWRVARLLRHRLTGY